MNKKGGKCDVKKEHEKVIRNQKSYQRKRKELRGVRLNEGRSDGGTIYKRIKMRNKE